MGALVALLIFFILVLASVLIGIEKQENVRKKIEDRKKLDEEKLFRLKMAKMNFDKLIIVNKDQWIAFKDNKIIGSLSECLLDNSAYGIGNNKIIILLPAPKGVIIIPSLGNKEDQEIIEYLDKLNVPMVQYSFAIHETDDLRDYVTFNTDVECAYKTDKKEKLLSISGSKNPNLKWKLTNIEFTPHYVTDYEVTTESKETGHVGGHAGAAAIGGLIGGTTGAVIGSSLGREINSTTVSHSSNSANEREVPAPALLTLESSNGNIVKIVEQLYEEDVIYLKKYFSVEDKTKDSSNTVKEENTNLVTELQNLKKMMDEGILTEEEFKLGKRKLLEG